MAVPSWKVSDDHEPTLPTIAASEHAGVGNVVRRCVVQTTGLGSVSFDGATTASMCLGICTGMRAQDQEELRLQRVYFGRWCPPQ